MRKLLLCFIFMLVWFDQDQLRIDLTTTENNSNDEFKDQVFFLLEYVLDKNYTAADSLLQVSILDDCFDSIVKTERLYELNYQTLIWARAFNTIGEYQKGRLLLEYIQPYLFQDYLSDWQNCYIDGFLSESLDEQSGGPNRLSLLRKVLELSEKWSFQESRVIANGEIGTIFVNMSEIDSAFYYLDEAVRIGQFYKLHDLCFKYLCLLTETAYLNGDITRFEMAIANADSAVEFMSEPSLIYEYYIVQFGYCAFTQNWDKLQLMLNKAEHWCKSLEIPLRHLYEMKIFSQTAWMYINKEDSEKALEYAQKALTAFRLVTQEQSIRQRKKRYRA